MVARPIILRTWESSAIVAGAKLQLRRPVKPQPNVSHDGQPYWFQGGYRAWPYTGTTEVLRMGGRPLANPYGKDGDLLWVKEAWARGIHAMAADRDEDGPFVYAADGTTQGRLEERWFSPVSMPRFASRTLLQVESVQVMRLQDISEGDARAEGVEPWAPVEDSLHGNCDLPRPASGWWRDYSLTPEEEMCGVAPLASARQSYQTLWEQIHGPSSWDANPWVWRVEFRRIES